MNYCTCQTPMTVAPHPPQLLCLLCGGAVRYTRVTHRLTEYLYQQIEQRGGLWFVGKDEFFAQLFQAGYDREQWEALVASTELPFAIEVLTESFRLSTLE